MRSVVPAAVLLLLFAGCAPDGPQRAEVSGTVKFNGELIPEGSINFFPTDGTKGPEAGAVITNGKFRIARADGPVVGKHTVELKYFGDTGQMVQDPTAPPGKMIPLRDNLFKAVIKEPIIREVKPKAADNVFDFDIVSAN